MPPLPLLWLGLGALLLTLVLIGVDSDGLLLVGGLAALLLVLLTSALPQLAAAPQLLLFAALVGGGLHPGAALVPPPWRTVDSPGSSRGAGRGDCPL